MRSRAGDDQIELQIIDGIALANWLAEDRQDLRQQFLGIPIGAHSRESVITATANRLEERMPLAIRDALSRRTLARPAADRRLNELLTTRNAQLVLATAVAGSGKSTWSARHAQSRARYQPVMWTSAKALYIDSPDPIGVHAVQAAFGTADTSRVIELADLLYREQMVLFAVLDAIDEVHDFGALLLALQDFQSSKLARHTHLLLTCRSESLHAISEYFASWQPKLLDSQRGRLIQLAPLSERERESFLAGEGATLDEVRRVTSALSPEFVGVPLFLKQALALARGGTLPDGRNIIDAFVQFALRDIQKRLHHQGQTPQGSHIKKLLSELALSAISDTAEAIDLSLTISRFGSSEMAGGENSLLGRATQVGLLERREDDQLGFAHALYLEYFAARAIRSESWPAQLASLEEAHGRLLARRLSRFLPEPTWLIRELLAIDPVVACDCAALAEDICPELAGQLVLAVERILSSRFRSDRTRALRLLSNLKTNKSRQAATAWWNSASRDVRNAHLWVAAELFLKLEVDGAFEIILGHHYFDPELPWYEPSFIDLIARLSQPFRQKLADWALAEFDSSGPRSFRHARLVTVLAMLGDPRYVECLNGCLDKGELLFECDFRALLHTNTRRAMEVYERGAGNALALPLEAEGGVTVEEKRSSRASRLEGIVPNGLDVRMHPHDAAIELSKSALSSADTDLVWFGMRLAELLLSKDLVGPYAIARRQLPSGLFDRGSRLVEGILLEATPAQLRQMYDENPDSRARADIVRLASKVPGPETEEFLIEILKCMELRSCAVKSLGELRAQSAAQAILGMYEESKDPEFRETCVQSLGRLAYLPSVAALANALERSFLSSDAKEKYSESAIVEALGNIGGVDAHDALRKALRRTTYPAHVIRALFAHECADPRDSDCELIAACRIGVDAVAEGLGSWRHDEISGFSNFNQVVPHLRFDRLLSQLMAGTDGRMLVNDGIWRAYLIRAVARFDLPAAVEFLESAAFQQDNEYALRILASRGHERAVRMRIESDLSGIAAAKREHLYGVAERWAGWPGAIVREALLARLQPGIDVAKWLFLLKSFASPTDIDLFRKFEHGDDLDAANVAHDFLNSSAATVARGNLRQAKSPMP